MTDYGHELLFGSSLTPTAQRPEQVVALAQLSEARGARSRVQVGDRRVGDARPGELANVAGDDAHERAAVCAGDQP
jgi:hypothetical protein